MALRIIKSVFNPYFGAKKDINSLEFIANQWKEIVLSIQGGYRREMYEEYVNDLEVRFMLGALMSEASSDDFRVLIAECDRAFYDETYDCGVVQGGKNIWSLTDPKIDLARRVPKSRKDFESHPMFNTF